jgi:hypothetical protein
LEGHDPLSGYAIERNIAMKRDESAKVWCHHDIRPFFVG